MHSLALVELQALVAALSLTGLFLGVMVDERERATEGLKASLRLAAAGEMAGAIAHEINQPLAALSNYGRACQLFLERGEGKVPYSELNATIEKMLGESKRAAEVVGRLRDFFRSGTTRLERVTVESLLETARRIGKKLDPSGEVNFRVENDEGTAVLLADRLQIELAAAQSDCKCIRSHSESANWQKRRHRLGSPGRGRPDSVPDYGYRTGGFRPRGAQTLVRTIFSTKPMGMGLGLAISQAIAEAHGGLGQRRADQAGRISPAAARIGR